MCHSCYADYIPGKESEALGIVKGLWRSPGISGRIFVDTGRMVDEAMPLGADAVVKVRDASASIMQSAAEIQLMVRR